MVPGHRGNSVLPPLSAKAKDLVCTGGVYHSLSGICVYLTRTLRQPPFANLYDVRHFPKADLNPIALVIIQCKGAYKDPQEKMMEYACRRHFLHFEERVS